MLLGILLSKGGPDVIVAISGAGARPLLAGLQRSSASESMRSSCAVLLGKLPAGSAPSSGAAASASASASAQAPARVPEIAGSPSSAASRQLPLRPKKTCWMCGATGVPLKKCSVCSVAAYCGAGCQKVDWKEHKGQCAGLKAGATSCERQE